MNKKGISQMVAYVILIVISLSLAVIVYGWLQLQIPKEKAECSSDISLIIKEVDCNYDTAKGEVSIKFQNKGLFTIDGGYIRGSSELDGAIDKDLYISGGFKQKGDTLSTGSFAGDREEGFLSFEFLKGSGLTPNEEYNVVVEKPGLGNNPLYEIEVVPFVSSDEDDLVLCNEKSLTREVRCT